MAKRIPADRQVDFHDFSLLNNVAQFRQYLVEAKREQKYGNVTERSIAQENIPKITSMLKKALVAHRMYNSGDKRVGWVPISQKNGFVQ